MSKELSVKMAAWLGHVRAASEQGLTIKAYATAHGVSAAAMYQAKSVLMNSGAWPRSVLRAAARSTQPPSPSKQSAKASAFVPVRVAGTVRSCRLSHVSGWSIECDDLPSTAWLSALLQGAGNAA